MLKFLQKKEEVPPDIGQEEAESVENNSSDENENYSPIRTVKISPVINDYNPGSQNI